MKTRVQHALEQLKLSGVRITPQRHAILAYLMDAMTHPTADEIYRALEPRFPSMSVATVYNNLKLFIEAGLVRELTYGDSSSRFDADVSDHYHAICEQCGKIVDFSIPSLESVEQTAAERTGFVVRGHRMEVYGVCQACAESASSK
ncbi:peroxide-responsive transcriptional repressor PerR [Paenibacillus apiarius]|uniref:Peroxide-responsive transcriptional repressor PerR n=1 Tax=Paenibacillus apiarius TaxID=46240 RepID=A0ABT4DPC7_9BACL|nr:peroxide-responsive transcriptional repressor PerR [Paenibacillus apiarius]MBN3525391.1 peroxide-responsive transcriptional repressor PerR [Paenibacillus apiarius]MCY9512761.1 peroxide-responsive transcriptional repressor PerR [Paenibacillus apiarius]MCY9519095.1 peroxide-responsive transcriptional repressor PerR [Paenibacillus apiarius]MCY9554719.1 peroxide-responsive transcriptional repressor PerR [Paenibacillus apiarius]MCY9559662.1 peroxide-responsive transcriptional repressor PerR [Pae